MTITKEQISSFARIGAAMKNLVGVHYPTKPNKPRLIGSDSKAHLDYAEKLDQYENDMAIYQAELVEYRKLLTEFDAAAKEYIMDKSGINSNVPEQYREKVWIYLYETFFDDADGFDNMLREAELLVDIFL